MLFRSIFTATKSLPCSVHHRYFRMSPFMPEATFWIFVKAPLGGAAYFRVGARKCPRFVTRGSLTVLTNNSADSALPSMLGTAASPGSSQPCAKRRCSWMGMPASLCTCVFTSAMFIFAVVGTKHALLPLASQFTSSSLLATVTTSVPPNWGRVPRGLPESVSEPDAFLPPSGTGSNDAVAVEAHDPGAIVKAAAHDCCTHVLMTARGAPSAVASQQWLIRTPADIALQKLK
mmetsp:Transcript_34656/g.73816  ORF Transcript_34656/g.73816 Transcript_34656/m.73816 type:complete len:232 (+) Transcript_34656:1191-1886(+)